MPTITTISPQITIDLAALAANWRALAARAPQAETAAVVKANAYGIGIEIAVPALWRAGCRTFFTALPSEAVTARAVAPAAAIYVLDGFFADDDALYRDFHLCPVLGNHEEMAQWQAFRQHEMAALHIDTGMNRLGLDHQAIGLDPAQLAPLGIDLLISHLAAADMPSHALNGEQLVRFGRLQKAFPSLRASLANSAGIFLGTEYHHQLTRPGIALYGGVSHPAARMCPVVTAEAPILQIRTAKAGETVGYGGGATLKRDSRIAVLAAGYADGYPRSAGCEDDCAGASVSIKGHKAPLIGRVSMDLITVDVTDIPENLLARGDMAELFGPNIAVDDVAAKAGTIGYEILTSLGRRFRRHVIGQSRDNTARNEL